MTTWRSRWPEPQNRASLWRWRPGWCHSKPDVDRTVDATDRAIPVTYIGHSYGGSILGTAEALGMTADRTVYLASAGAGFGVDDSSE